MSKNNKIDDFDYFGNQQVIRDIDSLERAARNGNDEELCKKIAHFKRLKRKERLNLFIMFVFILASIYMIFDLRSELAYYFSADRAPIQLGQAGDLDINKLHHNDYVTLTGVTDYRAAAIKRVRNLNPTVKEYRYFHLAGSRIFLEVDGESKIVPMQEVTVSGRVVDARLDNSFNSLLDFLRTKFLFNVGDNVRFIQVGQAPGQEQTNYIIVLGIFAFMWIFNLISFIRHRQQASLIIGPNLLSGATRR